MTCYRSSVEPVRELEPVIKAYIQKAIEAEDGLEMPEALLQQFDEDPAFEVAFESLTPGRQRGDLLYFSFAKQWGKGQGARGKVQGCMVHGAWCMG
ncbi:MAG: YdeI/OmpD-associated family protein [Anaerolineales bacterium]|nr:YdeI/OmpD-associated family protein [Anaerolineales bacterium]